MLIRCRVVTTTTAEKLEYVVRTPLLLSYELFRARSMICDRVERYLKRGRCGAKSGGSRAVELERINRTEGGWRRGFLECYCVVVLGIVDHQIEVLGARTSLA